MAPCSTDVYQGFIGWASDRRANVSATWGIRGVETKMQKVLEQNPQMSARSFSKQTSFKGYFAKEG